jgi:hypothetical protein
MPDDTSKPNSLGPQKGCSPVADLMSRRRSDDVLHSVTLVFGGVNYGTFPVAAPYTRGSPLVLYVVPSRDTRCDDSLTGPIDCLITDEATVSDLGLAK